MASEPLPDHYKTLGVDKNADAAAIKASHRKLVLKCHPDKVTDPTLKQQATEKFQEIQQAYETLIDDEKRKDYEAHLTLEALRREKAARGASREEKTARFDVRTSGGASFTATGPSRYATEERKPSRSYDDDHTRYFEERARSKYDTYDAYPRSGTTSRSARTEKESSSRSSKPSPTDRTRSDREKTRSKETRSNGRFVSLDSESSEDDKARHEKEYKRRSAEAEAKQQAADSRRKADDRRSYEDPRYAASTSRKMSSLEEEAIRYQHKSRTQVEDEMSRPSPTRTASRDYFGDSRSSRKETRPEAVRRSSARPKERTASSGRERDRGSFPEIVEWGGEDSRRPPTFKHSNSSPANIELPRTMPVRSYTESSRDHRHAEKSPPPPSFHRSATMPTVPHSSSSSRRKDSTVPRPSGLRETMTSEHHSPERDAFASIPQPSSASKHKYYHYPTPGASTPLRPEDLGNHRTILREPGRQHREPSPLGRPPIGANRPSETSSTTYAPQATARPSVDRTSSARVLSPLRNSEERGRTRPKLYGEVGRDSRGRQASYSPGDISFSQRYGPEDVRWAPRSRENEREPYSKPSLGRTATYVY